MNSSQLPQDRFKETVLNNIIEILRTPTGTSEQRLRMTQKDLAELIGITPPQLSKILRNGNPTLETLWQISNALKVDPIALFKNTERVKMDPKQAEVQKYLDSKKS